MQKEHEIEKTLQSLDGLEKPQLSPLMAQRILRKATSQPAINETDSSVWSWAFGVAVLLLVNMGMVFWMQSQPEASGNEADPSVSYFDNSLSY